MGEKEKEVLSLVCLTLKELAASLGVSYTSVRNWSAGRPMPSDARRALAAFMRTHAARLVKLAEELEG